MNLHWRRVKHPDGDMHIARYQGVTYEVFPQFARGYKAPAGHYRYLLQAFAGTRSMLVKKFETVQQAKSYAEKYTRGEMAMAKRNPKMSTTEKVLIGVGVLAAATTIGVIVYEKTKAPAQLPSNSNTLVAGHRYQLSATTVGSPFVPALSVVQAALDAVAPGTFTVTDVSASGQTINITVKVLKDTTVPMTPWTGGKVTVTDLGT